jgi:hypothetical protein
MRAHFPAKGVAIYGALVAALALAACAGSPEKAQGGVAPSSTAQQHATVDSSACGGDYGMLAREEEVVGGMPSLAAGSPQCR